MKITDFDIYAELLKKKSGLSLDQEKSYLLESRLGPVARKWEYASVETMATALQGVPDEALVNDIVEAMTTNETSFFRDQHPFESFENQVLPYLLKTRIHERRFKIWCAAASSGQEPYSLAMKIKEQDQTFASWNIDIIATDISNDILTLAQNGTYSQFEVQRGLPIQLLMKYFTQIDEKWKISDSILKMVKFEYFNLLDSMDKFGQLDVIFCRNVLIYFDEADKKTIMAKMEKQLKPDGYLFLGGAETVIGITDAFKPIPGMRGVYAKPDSVHHQKDSSEKSQALA